MSSSFRSDVIGKLYRVVLQLLMVKSADGVEVSDENASTLKEELMSELANLAGTSASKAVKTACELLTAAVDVFATGGATPDAVLMRFGDAEASAGQAFGSSSVFEMKVLSTKIQLVCILHRFGFFHETFDPAEMAEFIPTCQEQLFALVKCGEVQSAMGYYETRLKGTNLFSLPGTKVSSFNILAEVSHIKVYVDLYTGQSCVLTGPSGTAFSLLEHVERRTRPGHKDGVSAIAVHNGRLYSCSEDGVVKVFDTASLSEIATLEAPSSSEEVFVSLSVSERRIFVGTDQDLIRVWDTRTLKFEGNLRGHGGCVNALLSRGDLLYSGSNDQTIKVWNSLCLSETSSMHAHTNAVQALAISGDKLFSGSWDSIIKVWDTRSFVQLAELSGHELPVRALIVANGRLYSGSRDKTIRVWDIASLAELATIKGHTEWVGALAVCGDRLYSGSDDGSVKVWDTKTFKEVVTIRGHAHWVRAVAVSGGTLYSGSGDYTMHVRLIG
jgi:WD40 repeat protein